MVRQSGRSGETSRATLIRLNLQPKGSGKAWKVWEHGGAKGANVMYTCWNTRCPTITEPKSTCFMEATTRGGGAQVLTYAQAVEGSP